MLRSIAYAYISFVISFLRTMNFLSTAAALVGNRFNVMICNETKRKCKIKLADESINIRANNKNKQTVYRYIDRTSIKSKPRSDKSKLDFKFVV